MPPIPKVPLIRSVIEMHSEKMASGGIDNASELTFTSVELDGYGWIWRF
jgi:hypothetical protein